VCAKGAIAIAVVVVFSRMSPHVPVSRSFGPILITIHVLNINQPNADVLFHHVTTWMQTERAIAPCLTTHHALCEGILIYLVADGDSNIHYG